jgi:hypothetical protein
VIELDNIAYQVNTTEENAQSILNSINTLSMERGLTDPDGNAVQFDANLANPLYLIIHGCAYIAARLQRLLYNLGCMMNIASASDRQVMMLADIARTRRYTPTKTIFKALVYSNGLGVCHITENHTVSIQLSGKTQKFHPTNETFIAPDSFAVVVFRAEQTGALIITAGQITRFDAPVPDNFHRMEQSQSVPGKELETIAALRSRLLNRRETTSGLDKCQEALSNLEGILACNIYFNYDAYYSVTINDLVIQPRRVGMFLLGYSPDVASTYWNYSTALTAGDSDPTCIKQDYYAANGQNHPVYWKPAIPRACWVHVYYRDTLSVDQRDEIVSDILKLMLQTSIGTPLTTADILGAIRSDYVMLGAELTLNEQGQWSYKITPNVGEYLDLKAENITTAQGVD